MKRISICVGTARAATFLATSAHADDHGETAEDNDNIVRVIGRSAVVAVAEGSIRILARVDTGAESSSIDARKIETFERDEEEWVRFETPLNDSEVVSFERPVLKYVVIKRSGVKDERRPIVKMDFCVADSMQNTEVNLADRSGQTFRMLLGREFLIGGGFIVNPAQEAKIQPSCPDFIEG